MVSGWHVGCRPEGSRPTSYIQRVWRSRVSSDEQRPIDWILLCLSVPSSVGCVARRNTAPWSPLHEEDAKRPIRERRSEEHTSELQSRRDLVCRLLLEKKKQQEKHTTH